jgi:hypothetical protein
MDERQSWLEALDGLLLGEGGGAGALVEAYALARDLDAHQDDGALYALLARYAGRPRARSARLLSFLLYLSACRGGDLRASAQAAYELYEEARGAGALDDLTLANLLSALGRVYLAGGLWDAQGRAHERLCGMIEAALGAPGEGLAALCALELMWLWLEEEGAAFRRGFDPAEQRRLRAAVAALEVPEGELLGYLLGRARGRLARLP